ncbi:MotA/TolQ/ExbB proton channel family protein [Bacillus sp. ISL-41]|uniref:MotA/TolQ/ExbB proton channel family protein n=1 Tax=Bacillus sp. ISL-41 TaxID=2819127 RepID=UPI001BE64B13|nr:MotA/TolQ/ExbB proton channel family protein [Bacillus sp. ISL-41]MBT2642866.1 MotA/TolQ/ExbB proton channel family protein [Bacillus sp. ISL-41]
MFALFESIYNWINNIGLNSFTSGFLFFQVAFFVMYLLLHYYMEKENIKAMKYIRTELNNLDSSLNIKELNKEINKIFGKLKENNPYRMQWERYFSRVRKENSIDEKIRVEPFFGYDVMHDTLGKRNILDNGSGIHVSLGVLGTFIGLAIGLSGLNMADPDLLREGVSGLIGGMKTAFYTSVLGVVFSILWIFIDSLITRQRNKDIEWHINKLHYFLNADDEEIFLNRLEKIQQHQTEQMKTLLTDALEKAMVPFVQTIEKGNQEITHQMKEQNETSLEHLHLMKNQSEDMANRIMDGVSESMNESIHEFSQVLRLAQENQDRMNSLLENTVEQFNQAAESNSNMIHKTENMVSTFTNLSEQMDETQRNYSSAQENLLNAINDIGNIQSMMVEHTATQKEMISHQQSFMSKSDELVNQFVAFGDRMAEVQNSMIETLVEKTDMVSKRFEELSNELVEASNNQKEASRDSADFMERAKVAIAELVPLSESLTTTINGLSELAESIVEMKDMQEEMIPKLDSWNTALVEDMRRFMTVTSDHLNGVTQQTRYSREQWESAAKHFESIKDELNSTMISFKDNMNQGVSETFKLFDEELREAVVHFKLMGEQYKNSVEHLTEYVNQIEEKVEQGV